MPRKKGGTETSVYDSIQKNSEIKGYDGSQYVKYKLDKGQSLIAATGAMIYMNSGIDKAEISYDGITSGIKRMLAGESFVYQKFTGISNSGTLVLGSSLINSVLVMKIYKDNEFRLSRYSFLAATDNIKISFTTQIKGLIGIGQEEGFFLPTAKCISGDYGYIWLSSFGSFERVEVPANDNVIVDNGMFLACNNVHQYTIEKIGKSLFSSFLGGEGFGMKFTGPATIFIQTKNINEFIQTLGGDNNDTQDNIANGVAKGAVKGFFEGLLGND